MQQPGEDSILFYKMADVSSAHTIVAGVKPFVPPSLPTTRGEFETLLRGTFEEQQKQSKRYDTDFEVAPDSLFGEYSVFVHSRSKDFNPAKLPSGAEYLLLDIYGYYIRIPESDTFLYVWYSERCMPADADPALSEKAHLFFDSFQLSSIRSAP